MTEQAFPIARYDLTTAKVAQLKKDYATLEIKGVEDKGGLALAHAGRMEIKGIRVAINKRRKEHNEGAREFIRQNDAKAKEITAPLIPLEAHLQAEEDRINAEKARLKEEAALKARAKVQNRIDAMAQYDAHLTVAEAMAMEEDSFQEALIMAQDLWKIVQARLDKEREQREEIKRIEQDARNAEAARMEEEAARLEVDRAVIEAEREKNRLEQEEATQKLQDERDRLTAEKRALDNDRRIEAARVEAAAQAVQDEKAWAEKARLDAIEAKRQEAEENERQEALRPDREKMKGMASDAETLALDWGEIPLSDKGAKEICDDAIVMLMRLAAHIGEEAKKL